MRGDLLHTSDQQIEESLEYAEPLVLRGLLYQLTGDEELVALELTSGPMGIGSPTFVLANPDDAAMIRRKAADFLKAYRDKGRRPDRHRACSAATAAQPRTGRRGGGPAR